MTTIITYNINGIRASLKKGLDTWINTVKPDIICLQEIKAKPEQFDTTLFNNLGYECFINSAQKPGYSGVAIISKIKPRHIEYGCGIEKIDFEGRVIRADYDSFSVISVYFPSGSSGELRQAFKIEFLDLFYKYILGLKKKIPNLIISGDYNICHKAIDIHNPQRNKNTSGFLLEEREWISKFIASGFIDSFRYLNKEPHNYSWWSYRANARLKNLGWRIDYNMISDSLLPRLKRAIILSEARHSDHCPVLVEIAE
ncbi:MAG: exodeoxyribonuclease III [Flavobacteriales bacterium]|nr:exodeoxyribonuclease III [Flavobacteriales bacterium]|tara:strand:- start:4744 stop:5511 length:768 start_codon:yes stop_codon:yes gene_type:complete